MKTITILSLALSLSALSLSAVAQDGLLGKKGDPPKSGGSGGGPAPKSEPKGERSPTRGNQNSGSTNSSSSGSVIQSSDARGNGDLLNKRTKSQSRSGEVRYDSSNNNAAKGRTKPVEFERPRTYGRGGSLEGQVNREENVRTNNNNSGTRYRSGYYAWDGRWTDNDFYYPHYDFRYNDRCAVSPWYDYPQLPGYINGDRIQFGRPLIEFRFDLGSYRWNYSDRYDRYSPTADLDQSVADLVRAFERRDERALGNLIPRRSQIEVVVDEGYAYRISSDDFYDLMLDAVQNSRTKRYKILDVKLGNGCARVWAEHSFTDSWNRTQYQYHALIFEETRRGYELVRFESRQDRGW